MEEIEITELIKQFSQSTDVLRRVDVAGNPNTDSETLKELAKDEHWEVRAAVAENTNLETLKKLAEDKEKFVREAAVKNPNYIDLRPLN